MLLGTEEEADYHERRAAEELSLSNRSPDPAASEAHLFLANLHRSRSGLVNAIRKNARDLSADRIYRTDKEG